MDDGGTDFILTLACGCANGRGGIYSARLGGMPFYYGPAPAQVTAAAHLERSAKVTRLTMAKFRHAQYTERQSTTRTKCDTILRDSFLSLSVSLCRAADGFIALRRCQHRRSRSLNEALAVRRVPKMTGGGSKSQPTYSGVCTLLLA